MRDKIAKWYKQGLWTADMVRSALDKGVITEEDYRSITGEATIMARAAANK